jgi:hypothetical protein
VYKIFEGQAGYYVRDENEDGLHHPPSDYGRRIGWDRPEAERVLAFLRQEKEMTENPHNNEVHFTLTGARLTRVGGGTCYLYERYWSREAAVGALFCLVAGHQRRGDDVRVTVRIPA